MPPLPSPRNVLTVNARPNGVTRFVQDGAGFVDGTTKVTVMHEVAGGVPQLTFVATAKALSATQLLVKMTCTPPAGKSRFALGTIKVTTTTGPGVDTGPSTPAVFQTHTSPIHGYAALPKIKLKYVIGSKRVFFLPITGLGAAVQADVVDAPKGKWKATAQQRTNRVRLILECLDAPVVVMAGGGGTGTISVTLIAEDESIVDIPPMELDFDDPDDDPNNP
jgi:hypothetical protein